MGKFDKKAVLNFGESLTVLCKLQNVMDKSLTILNGSFCNWQE